MRVAVACSGGVDSSVALLRLMRDGYDCGAFTLKLLDGSKSRIAIQDAAKVAGHLGVDHYVFDIREEFRSTVIEEFINEYSVARTPNPCIRCNEIIKFGMLRRAAQELGYDYLATGHYARIAKTGNEFALFRGRDPKKDQAYALYRLSRSELARTLFPLGELTKWAVRQLAVTSNLPVSCKEESQDICFVEGGYCEFLSNMGIASREGDILDVSGKRLGRHSGIHRFTIGQRRNLGLPGGTAPLYVVKIDRETNSVVLGGKEHLLSRSFTITKCNWLVDLPPGEPKDCQVKVRYRSPMRPGRFTPYCEGNALVELFEPQEAVTPGQSAVMFEGDRVLGGGFIDEVHTIAPEEKRF
ncbi:MAG: tRNA 2-thiouridine(34) synthase MnmA [Planctomycetota bacterium]